MLTLSAPNPSHLVMPGATQEPWTRVVRLQRCLLTSLIFTCGPNISQPALPRGAARFLRRNAVLMPLYSITTPLMFFVGLSAVLVLPGLGNGDLALLTIVRKTFPAWFLGIVGGAGALTAMVPAQFSSLPGQPCTPRTSSGPS